MINDNAPPSRVTSKGVFPYQYAFTLLNPLRNIFLSPRRLLERLSLKPTYQVLEIGPGPGYFSIPVARAVYEGKLFLYDIQPQMMAKARKRIEKKGITNVEYHLASETVFPFDDNSFDVIFLVTVFGEIAEREIYLREMYRTLRPGGLVSVSELPFDPHQMPLEWNIRFFEEAGFVLDRQFGKKHNFTLNFRKLHAL